MLMLIRLYVLLFAVAKQPNSGLRHLIVEVSRIHKHTHTASRTPLNEDQLLSYTARNKHKTETSITSVGFEPTIPVIKLLQTYTLDCTAAGIGLSH
jgi:hypothetical protein